MAACSDYIRLLGNRTACANARPPARHTGGHDRYVLASPAAVGTSRGSCAVEMDTKTPGIQHFAFNSFEHYDGAVIIVLNRTELNVFFSGAFSKSIELFLNILDTSEVFWTDPLNNVLQ